MNSEDGKFEISLDDLDNLNFEKNNEADLVCSAPLFTKNPPYVRKMLEDVLKKYSEHFHHLKSNQFALVQKNGQKPAKFTIKKVDLLKGGKKLFFQQNPECPDAQFYLEIDKLNFGSLDEKDQEKALFRQLCKIWYDIEKEKYVVFGPDAEIYAAMVKAFGSSLDEIVNVQRMLEQSDENEDE